MRDRSYLSNIFCSLIFQTFFDSYFSYTFLCISFSNIFCQLIIKYQNSQFLSNFAKHILKIPQEDSRKKLSIPFRSFKVETHKNSIVGIYDYFNYLLYNKSTILSFLLFLFHFISVSHST